MTVVHSLLENDLYKFSMWKAFLHSKHAGKEAEYSFLCRSTPDFPLAELKEQIESDLDHLCSLKFQEDELEYLDSKSFLKGDFIHFLRLFQFQRRFIKVYTVGDLLIIKAKGPLIHVMGFEIHVLCIVSEVYMSRRQEMGLNFVDPIEVGRQRLREKVDALKQFYEEHKHEWEIKTLGKFPLEIFDFGLRRRYSGEWQDEVVATLLREVPEIFKGTSNVYLAKKYGITPIGTMAHEYLQAYQGFDYRLRDFQKMALEGWVQEFRGELGIALTDVVGMDAFLVDFDLYFAKLFDGLRHDSGDPFEWARKAIDHYKKMKIDPRTKRLVFSDGLDLEKTIALWKEFSGTAMLGFGIGTNLTNDLGVKALNIVMKLVFINGQPVAKLSDSPGKTLCEDETFLAYLSKVFNKERQ